MKARVEPWSEIWTQNVNTNKMLSLRQNYTVTETWNQRIPNTITHIITKKIFHVI